MAEPAVRLQRATAAEQSALAALMLEANRHYWGVVEGAAEMTAKVAQAIIQGRSGVGAYLILDAGTPVGFATVSILHPAPTEAGTFFMKDLYVSGATRGRGLGRVAMHLLATEAMRLGCQRFDWTAERDNPGALAFYDAFGAERVEDKVYFRLSGDRLQRAAAPDRMKGKAMPTIPVSTIHDTSRAALIRHGAADWIAEEVARAVADSEAHGNRICGLYYLESYCQQLASGRVRGDAEPVVTRPRPGTVQADGQLGFAQPAFARALPQAIEAARENGTAQLAVGHTHTCTSVGYFVAQIARAGLIGLGMTNASPIVAPPGGKTRVIGTNPIAFAVPDGQGGVAMQFDQSTTTVALGKITMAKAAGEPIPQGWAIDANGAPTTDAEAALGGSLTSAGGYKGWGFGLMAELLAAGMTGSVISRQVKPLKAPQGPPHDLGQFYLLIDPGTAPGFFDTVTAVAQGVAQDPGTRMPGQGRRPAEAVEVPEDLWGLAMGLATGQVT